MYSLYMCFPLTSRQQLVITIRTNRRKVWKHELVLAHSVDIKVKQHGFYTPPRISWRVYILTAVCLCMCLCVQVCLWKKFQLIGCTDLNAVYAKWLLTTLAQTLSKLVTLGQRSRSQWLNIHFSSLTSVNLPTVYLISLMSDQTETWYAAWMCALQICT